MLKNIEGYISFPLHKFNTKHCKNHTVVKCSVALYGGLKSVLRCTKSVLYYKQISKSVVDQW